MTFETVQADCLRLIAFCRENKATVLNLELNEVTHCDSAGLALLIEAKRLCATHNITCNITGMSKMIRALAEFCGVDTMLGLEA
jgi:phospholipid transport system transporter-binding protein